MGYDPANRREGTGESAFKKGFFGATGCGCGGCAFLTFLIGLLAIGFLLVVSGQCSNRPPY